MKRRHGINTSRSTRSTYGEGNECEPPAVVNHVYQEMQAGNDVYQTQPTLSPYMYNVYSLSQVAMDPIAI